MELCVGYVLMRLTLYTPADLSLTTIIGRGQQIKYPYGGDTLRSDMTYLILTYILVYLTKMHAIMGSFITTKVSKHVFIMLQTCISMH